MMMNGTRQIYSVSLFSPADVKIKRKIKMRSRDNKHHDVSPTKKCSLLDIY